MALPPGLTCDQYYLYLASGYAYSPTHGVMYATSQVPSVEWISTFLRPHSLRPEETSYWLLHRHYYDFNQKCWIKATFHKPERFQERIWQEASQSQISSFRFQQKADDVMQLMSSMSLIPKADSAGRKEGDKVTRQAVKISTCLTMRDRLRRKPEIADKGELRRVQVKESKQKSRRAKAVKEKIKTLPSNLSSNTGFWMTVI